MIFVSCDLLLGVPNSQSMTVGQFLRCEIPWPVFSRKPPALTSINRKKSTINPEIASIDVCKGPIFRGFPSVSADILTAPLQFEIWHPQYGLFGTIPAKKGPGNLTPEVLIRAS